MFIEKLKVTEWMDDEVVGLAIDKVHKIEQKIGYPTKVRGIEGPFCRVLTIFRAPTSWIHQASGITITRSM